MEEKRIPEKIAWVRGNFSGQYYAVADPTHYSGESVIATYIREDLTLDHKLQQPGAVTIGQENQERRCRVFEHTLRDYLCKDWSYLNMGQPSDEIILGWAKRDAELILSESERFASKEKAGE